MWIDITMPLHKHMPVWPGDTPFTYKLDATLEQDGANVGQIQMSLHAGTHIDAPFHYDSFGKAIDAVPFELFIGPALVIDVVGAEQVTMQHIVDIDVSQTARVLFKTKEAVDFYRFEQHYTDIHPAVIHFLHGQGVQVIGTDAPSIDAYSDETLQGHMACKETGMFIIENLVLKDVKAGIYDMIAMPLAIQGADASPVRAALKPSTNHLL